MAVYETMVIVSLSDEAIPPILDKVKGIIEANGGSAAGMENLGSRPLEFAIRKQTKGVFVLFTYTGDRRVTSEVEKFLRLTEGILRCMTVRVDERKAAPSETGP